MGFATRLIGSNIRFSVLPMNRCTGELEYGPKELWLYLLEPSQLPLSCSVRLLRFTHLKRKKNHLHWEQGWKCVAQWTVASGSGRAAQKVADRANRSLPAGSGTVTCNRHIKKKKKTNKKKCMLVHLKFCKSVNKLSNKMMRARMKEKILFSICLVFSLLNSSGRC